MSNIVRKIIRIGEVKVLTGLRGKEPYRKSGDPDDTFPAMLELGPHSRGWYEDEILHWRNTRPRTVLKRVLVQPTGQEADDAHAA